MGGLLWVALCVGACWYAWRRWGRKPSVSNPAAEPDSGRWNFHPLKPRLPKEPTATDILVANAPEPVDPIGYIKAKTIREMVKNISPEDKNWSAPIPSAEKPCYLCGSDRIPVKGILACPLCDSFSPRKDLETA